MITEWPNVAVTFTFFDVRPRTPLCLWMRSRCLRSASAASSVLSLYCRCQPLEVAVEGHPIPNDVFEHRFACSAILDLRLGEGEGATVIAGPCGDQD